MNAKQRAQVVELLRCAHDCEHAINTTAFELGINAAVWTAAADARRAFYNVVRELGMAPRDYYDECLEAAQRVEEGTWP